MKICYGFVPCGLPCSGFLGREFLAAIEADNVQWIERFHDASIERVIAEVLFQPFERSHQKASMYELKTRSLVSPLEATRNQEPAHMK